MHRGDPVPVSCPFRPPRSGGHTLLELITTLLLLGMAWSLLHPVARRWTDRSAVEGARERVVGLLDRARSQARADGGAEVEIRADEGVLTLRSGDVEVARADLRTDGISLDAGGGGDTIVIRFDALGLGRVASRTLTFRRRDGRAELVVSALGRVTRR